MDMHNIHEYTQSAKSIMQYKKQKLTGLVCMAATSHAAFWGYVVTLLKLAHWLILIIHREQQVYILALKETFTCEASG